MAELSPARKTDRRTLYTRQVIKDALLELLPDNPYEKINVTMLCKQAEITRATFYLHYADLNEVLDELITEALEIAEDSGYLRDYEKRDAMLQILLDGGPDALKGNENYLAPCQRIADNPKYRPLFMDDGLSNYIIRKIYLAERDSCVPSFAKSMGISMEDADRVFMFHIYGFYFVNRSMKWEKNDDWYRIQYILNKTIHHGIEDIKTLPEKHRKGNH